MDCSGSDDGMGVVIDLRVLSYHRNLVVVAIIVFGDNMLCTLLWSCWCVVVYKFIVVFEYLHVAYCRVDHTSR